MDVLRHLGSLDCPISDVDISPVNLEQLYEYFTARELTTRAVNTIEGTIK
jgi:hypothetical protein